MENTQAQPHFFAQWQIDKKVKPTDLVFTQALKSSVQQQLFEKAADLLCSLRPSFSEGIKTLELIAELILMGHAESLFETASSFEAYQNSLRALRYPHTTQNDATLKTKLENLPWPSQAKIKFERRGDRAGVEVKFFVSSGPDLTKVISALERVQTEIGK